MKLTAREKALLREFDTIAQENPDKHSPKAKDWFDKVKASFGGAGGVRNARVIQ